MNPKKIIEQVSKADLSKARGKRQEHSTRDYPKFMKILDHVISVFDYFDYELIVKEKGGGTISKSECS